MYVCVICIYHTLCSITWKGPCEGDSGGPLFLQEETGYGPRSTLIGIVAGGLGCGKSIPTWYTNVSIIEAQIREQMSGPEIS